MPTINQRLLSLMPYQFDKDKFVAFIEKKSLSRYAFAKLTGINEGRISQLCSGKLGSPSADVLCKILDVYPDTVLNDFFTDKQ